MAPELSQQIMLKCVCQDADADACRLHICTSSRSCTEQAGGEGIGIDRGVGRGGPALSHKWKLNKILAKSSLQILWANFNEVAESSQNVDECRHATDKLINYAKEVKIMPTSGMILKDMWDSSRQGNVMTEFLNYKCQARALSSHANCCPVRTLSSPTNCIIVRIHLGSQLF